MLFLFKISSLVSVVLYLERVFWYGLNRLDLFVVYVSVHYRLFSGSHYLCNLLNYCMLATVTF